METVKQKHF